MPAIPGEDSPLVAEVPASTARSPVAGAGGGPAAGSPDPESQPAAAVGDQRPVAPAAAARSAVPVLPLAIALVVIGLAAAAIPRVMLTGSRDRRWRRPASSRRAGRRPDGSGTGGRPLGSSTAFLVALGRAMLDSGASVTQVGASLQRVADVYGLEQAGIVVLPTALFVSVPGRQDVHTSIAPAGRGLRLDQIDAVFRIVDAAEHGEIGVRSGLRGLAAARRMPPPFPPRVRLLGYPLLSCGLVLILHGTAAELLVAMVLAIVVGALQLLGSRVADPYLVFLPVLSSFAVSVAVFALARAGAPVGSYIPLVAALITFLPGALLTTAVIELATGQMLSGAGRLAQGATQLVLLAIGIIAAGQLVGLPATTLGRPTGAAGDVLPWFGLAVFGIGVVLANDARPSSLRWILAVLYVAYAGQLIGAVLFGAELSAFVGALLMTPVAMLAASMRSGPPTLVTFLPAFWLLVPGAASLAAVTSYLSDDRFDGTDSLVIAGSAMLAITFGVLLGLALGSLVGLGSGVGLSAHPPSRDSRMDDPVP